MGIGTTTLAEVVVLLIAVDGGKFGERWVDLCQTYKANTIVNKVEWGKAPTAVEIKNLLEAHPDTKAVYLTHSETSTGAATDVKALSKLIHENSNALVCVDGIKKKPIIRLECICWNFLYHKRIALFSVHNMRYRVHTTGCKKYKYVQNATRNNGYVAYGFIRTRRNGFIR